MNTKTNSEYNAIEEKNKTDLRVTVFLSGLQAGGAERVAIRICEWLKEHGHRVTLLTFSNPNEDFYAQPEGVTRIGLDVLRPSNNFIQVFFNNFIRMKLLRQSVVSSRADVVISLCNTNNALMLLALVGFSCGKIISERTDPVRNPPSRRWRMLQYLVYPMAHLHVSQSAYVSRWLHKRFPRLRCVTIGNTAGLPPPNFKHKGSKYCQDGRGLRLITVGRLTKQKGIDILLHALANAKTETPIPLELCIAGDGEDKDQLEFLTHKLGLADQVKFLGKVGNIWDELAVSDAFVLASRWEGFPNALIEAMSAGLPSITARCEGGVEDILDNASEKAALEFQPGDISALSRAIVQLANSAKLRHQLSIAGQKRAGEYSPEVIAKAWLQAVQITCDRN